MLPFGAMIKSMVLINGAKAPQIEVVDRGFQYGDGVFETILVKKGTPLFLSKHLERLIHGCQILGIPFEDKRLLTREITDLTQCYGDHGVIKIILTRGVGGRGYKPPEKPSPTRVISIQTKPVFPESYEKQGVKVMLCQTRLGVNTALAGIKHLNRLEQILASQEWNDPNIQEGLMLDQAGRLIEGTKSNLFVVKSGVLYTPKIDNCGVSGVMRSLVMDAAIKYGLEVKEARISVVDVTNADEVFLTNSIIILWPVKQFVKKVFNVGPITHGMQDWLLKAVELEIGK